MNRKPSAFDLQPFPETFMDMVKRLSKTCKVCCAYYKNTGKKHECGCTQVWTCGFVKDKMIVCVHDNFECNNCAAPLSPADLEISICSSCYTEIKQVPGENISPLRTISPQLMNPSSPLSKKASVSPAVVIFAPTKTPGCLRRQLSNQREKLYGNEIAEEDEDQETESDHSDRDSPELN